MVQQRKIGYALSEDGYHIAYADLGEGELSHVFMPEGVSAVDEIQWQHPGLVRFERVHASLSRLVMLDPRGLGVSDAAPLDRCFAPKEWAKDILAVLDTLEIERAVITGEGYSGHAAAYFAVAHPERTLRLSLYNSYAQQGYPADDGKTPYSKSEVDAMAAEFEKTWGTGRLTQRFCPALVQNASYLEYAAARERRTSNPAAAAARLRATVESDIRELLPRITVPTLVYYTGDLTHITAEDSRYLAEHIPDAILVENPGGSFYDPAEVERLNAWAEFLVGGPAALSHENKLLTLLFTDVVGSTKQAVELGDARWTRTLEDLDAYVSQRAAGHGGRVIKQTGDGHLIAFELPRNALAAACEIANGVDVLGVDVRCGLHTGEVELKADGDLGGIAVHAAARVCEAAAAKQVLASRTVADLAAGSDFRFEDCGAHDLKGVPGSWILYEVHT